MFHAFRDIGVYIDIPYTIDLADWRSAHVAMRDLEAGSIANPTENRQVGHYWLRNPALAAPEIAAEIVDSWEHLAELKEKIAQGGYHTLLMIGIGGSALGPQLLVDALPTRGLQVRFLDNTDLDGIHRTLHTLSLEKTLVAVLSKSGGTKETRNAMLETRALFAKQGLDFAKQSIAVTVSGSQLDRLAKDEQWFGRLPLWDWVGGRTSITGMVGLLVLSCMGYSTEAFIQGARDMDQLTRSLHESNPAMLLANLWCVEGNAKGDRNMVVLPYKDSLGLFGRYLQQLVMESIGKKEDRDSLRVDQGLSVYGNKGSTDQHAFVQQLRDGRHDFFVLLIGSLQTGATSLEVEPNITTDDYLTGFLLGTRHALQSAGRTVSTIWIEGVDERRLGALVALFERTVGFYAEKLNLNAYDQPGVEAGKHAAQQMLDLKRAIQQGQDVSAADPLDVWVWKYKIAQTS